MLAEPTPSEFLFRSTVIRDLEPSRSDRLVGYLGCLLPTGTFGLKLIDPS